MTWILRRLAQGGFHEDWNLPPPPTNAGETVSFCSISSGTVTRATQKPRSNSLSGHRLSSTVSNWLNRWQIRPQPRRLFPRRTVGIEQGVRYTPSSKATTVSFRRKWFCPPIRGSRISIHNPTVERRASRDPFCRRSFQLCSPTM